MPVAEIPQQPPLEIVKQGRVWVLETYRRGKRTGTSFSTHDTQMDAVRSAKSKMDDDDYPCVLRWESADSVREIHWNPLFECVEIRYDEVIDAWTIVPEQGTCAIAICETATAATERAKQIQRNYDFKHLRLYNRDGTVENEREHRFLRYDITSSGIRFNIDKIESDEPEEPDPEETEEETEEESTYTRPATPGVLGVSVPDVTKVEFVDTNGTLHRFATPWGDGTNAEILSVARTQADEPGVPEAFASALDTWRGATDASHVASIYESGDNPAPWVAYQSGAYSLAEVGLDLPVEKRLDVIDGIARAVAAMTEVQSSPCGIRPANVHLRGGPDWHVTVGTWGIEWAVNAAAGTDYVNPFTAPEQLDGKRTEQTVVYQTGATAYWLLCEDTPVDETHQRHAIQSGQLQSPRTVSGVSTSVEDILATAVATRPDERYPTVGEFYRRLTETF